MVFLEMTSHPGLVIREIPADESEVQELFAAAEDYFRAATGEIAAPGDVRSLFYAVPEERRWTRSVCWWWSATSW